MLALVEDMIVQRFFLPDLLSRHQKHWASSECLLALFMAGDVSWGVGRTTIEKLVLQSPYQKQTRLDGCLSIVRNVLRYEDWVASALSLAEWCNRPHINGWPHLVVHWLFTLSVRRVMMDGGTHFG